MSKKNNYKKDKKYQTFLLRKEKERRDRAEEIKKRKEDKQLARESGRMINEARNKLARKPKVPPVIGSQVKLEKMLAKSMKSLTIG